MIRKLSLFAAALVILGLTYTTFVSAQYFGADYNSPWARDYSTSFRAPGNGYFSSYSIPYQERVDYYAPYYESKSRLDQENKNRQTYNDRNDFSYANDAFSTGSLRDFTTRERENSLVNNQNLNINNFGDSFRNGNIDLRENANINSNFNEAGSFSRGPCQTATYVTHFDPSGKNADFTVIETAEICDDTNVNYDFNNNYDAGYNVNNVFTDTYGANDFYDNSFNGLFDFRETNRDKYDYRDSRDYGSNYDYTSSGSRSSFFDLFDFSRSRNTSQDFRFQPFYSFSYF